MSIVGKRYRPGFQRGGMCRPCRPMIDSMNGGIAEAQLKPLRIFPQIMQQARDACFLAGTKRCRELRGEGGDIPQMILQ